MANDDLVVPQLAFPLRLGPDGDFAQVEQDSLEDVQDSVEVLLSTTVGEREELPEYGIPQIVFGEGGDGMDLGSINDALEEWEPRARVKLGVALDSQDELINYVRAQVSEVEGA